MTDSGSALSGISVVECGEMVSAAYATKLMADLGADVVKVEPPEGDAARRRGPYPPGREGDPHASGLFIYLNANKRGITLDLSAEADREALLELLGGADVFIHNFSPDQAQALRIDYDAIRERCPQLICTSVTPFGLSGPYARWQADELNVIAAGGWVSLSPGDSRDPALPPLKAFGRQGDFQAATTAAIATMGALLGRAQRGGGQLVEVSGQEVMVTELEVTFANWVYAKKVVNRLAGSQGGLMGIMPCKDGQIHAMAAQPRQWDAFLEMMGNPDWGRDDRFKDLAGRREHGDALALLIEDWLRQRTVEEVFELAGESRLPFAPVSTVETLLASPHLKAREHWATLDQPGAGTVTMPGAPFRMSEAPWRLRRPAPRLGEHTDEVLGAKRRIPPAVTRSSGNGGRPLEGVRVVDMTWMWVGPHCSEQLAHLGAEVIRIETAARPCLNRISPPFADEVVGVNRAGGFNQFNQGKRSMLLDVKQPDGLQIAYDLIAQSDIFLENFAAGVIDRLGLGWPKVSEMNSRLIMLSFSGYGLSGPYSDRVAFGGPIVMFSGLASMTGYPGGGPSAVGSSYPDPNAALHGAFAALSALQQRQATGKGQRVELSLADALIAILPEGILPYTMRGEMLPRMGNHDIQMAPHGLFRSAGDDRWVSIVIRDDAEWQRFARIIGGALERDPRFATQAERKRHEAELDALVTAWTSPRDAWEITRMLQDAGLAAFPVFGTPEVADDPHMNGRGFFTELEHPETGRRKHSGIPWKYSETPLEIASAAPCIGEANEYVITELLGRSQEEYRRLAAAGVLT